MKPRIVLFVIGLVVAVVAIGVSVALNRQAHQTPEQVIEAWALAAEHDDTSRMRALMEPNEFAFLTWRDWWSGARRAYGIQPSHAISGVEQRGETTVAVVHFRTADGAVCIPVQVGQHNKLAIAGTANDCAFPSSGGQP